MRKLFHIAIPILFLIAGSMNSFAQVSPQFYDYPYNHLPWYTIESENFLVHYQEGSSRSAQIASKIAEEIYEPITSLYRFEPTKKVSIVMRDREDYSNGAAFFFDDKIEIWVPALDTPLRGTHTWMQNVITHEFTHIVQLQASMKRTKTIPAIYLQWLSYEDVRRPDVLYGFPNGILTKPFATVSAPAWFVEGTAQYQRSGLEYDYWDSHRDMILRTKILSGTYQDFRKMGIFSSKTSLERELTYNQGFGFVIYLVGRFGEDVVADISHAAANSGKNNFSKVIEAATGVSGEDLFEDWINNRNEYYNEFISDKVITETEKIESEGYFNFYPQYSDNGEWFGYLSNKGRDIGRTMLILIKDDEEIIVDEAAGPDMMDSEQQYKMNHSMGSNLVLDFIANRFSFAPDNSRIVYSRADKNRYGETYQDIYIYDLSEEESRQITESARIQEPAWSPDGEKIAAVQQYRGTQNIVLVNPDDGETSQLTNYSRGETVYTPVWHPNGKTIYFAGASTGSRNIYKVEVESGTVAPVFEDRYVDYRDPWIDPSGKYLYHSSDINGVFNILRYNLDNKTNMKLTEVAGGAFMPFVRDQKLYFAEYTSGGYKISSIQEEPINVVEPFQTAEFPFEVYSATATGTRADTLAALNQTDVSDIGQIPVDKSSYAGEPIAFEIETLFGSDERTWQPYSETTTGLSVFPVIRFDNYTKLNGSNVNLLTAGNFGSLGENIWRDLKIGAYLSSRDVTENISIFGGALIGFGSLPAEGVNDFFKPARLNDLDRDVFMIIEHRGIPFIKRSWSPTISVEVYNLKRNVRDGITIEEFACTSCLPESRGIDIRYSIWEANLFFRSKLNRWSLLELGAGYSPYSVSTEGFFSNELRQFIPGSTSQYFRGATYSASYIADLTIPERNSDIAPRGIKGRITYKYQPSKLLDEFEVNDGVLSPVFASTNNHSVEFESRTGFRLLDNSTGMFTGRVFSYLNNPEDFFYLDYMGGLIGLRSYPFFAVGGQTTAYLRSSFITPIFQSINRQVGAYTIDKVFAHFYVETGNGWGGPLNIGDNLKSGLGAELRVAFNSYYLFPMKLFVNTSYGLNRFDVTFPETFVTGTDDNTVTYGREFLIYFGLTFDFEFL